MKLPRKVYEMIEMFMKATRSKLLKNLPWQCNRLFYSIGKFFISVKNKQDVLSHGKQFKSICGAARHFSTESQKLSSFTYFAWPKIENELVQKLKTNSAAITAHRGPSITYYNLEQQVYD